MFTETQVHEGHTERDAVEVCGTHLAARVREALRATSYVPELDVDIEVRDHAVYLSGLVKWEYQRVAAERAVEHLEGVHVLNNGIRVLPRVSASQIEKEIRVALHDEDTDSEHRVEVDVDDESVTLTGAVASYTDRQVAEHAARSIPSVGSVSNQLRIVKYDGPVGQDRQA